MKMKSKVVFLFSLILILSFISLFKVNAQATYTEIFYPDLASRNGFIYINSTSYPVSSAEQHKYFLGNYAIEHDYFVNWMGEGPAYVIYHTYMSFNTSSLLDTEDFEIVSAKFYLTPSEDYSEKDFSVIVYSGKNQWLNSSTCSWNKCPNYEAIMLNTVNLVCEKYYSCSIGTTSISTTGLTQFRLINNNEGTAPVSREGLWIFSWNDTDWKPYLEIKWRYISESRLKSIDILNMDLALNDALGLPHTKWSGGGSLGGIILSFALIFGFILLPLACLRAPLLAYVVMIFGIAGIFIAIGWLPIWFVFMEVFLIAVMLSSTLTKILTGE